MYSFCYSRYVLDTDNLVMFVTYLKSCELNNMWERLKKSISFQLHIYLLGKWVACRRNFVFSNQHIWHQNAAMRGCGSVQCLLHCPTENAGGPPRISGVPSASMRETGICFVPLTKIATRMETSSPFQRLSHAPHSFPLSQGGETARVDAQDKVENQVAMCRLGIGDSENQRRFRSPTGRQSPRWRNGFWRLVIRPFGLMICDFIWARTLRCVHLS